jgi:hypothetical protein
VVIPQVSCSLVVYSESYSYAVIEPGKRALVLGMNGFGNLSGVIGAQLFQASYAPRYLIPFYATLGFVATSLLGYLAYRYTLLAVNKWRARQMAGWTDADAEAERLSTGRFGDKKLTFMYARRPVRGCAFNVTPKQGMAMTIRTAHVCCVIPSKPRHETRLEFMVANLFGN